MVHTCSQYSILLEMHDASAQLMIRCQHNGNIKKWDWKKDKKEIKGCRKGKITKIQFYSGKSS